MAMEEAVRTYTYPGEETLGWAVMCGLVALAMAGTIVFSPGPDPFRLLPTLLATAATAGAIWCTKQHYNRVTWTLTRTHLIVSNRSGERRYSLSEVVGLSEHRRFIKHTDGRPMYELRLADRTVLKLLDSDANDFIHAISKLSGVPIGQGKPLGTP